MTSLRERLERGSGMRAQRLVEGLLLAASFVFDDLRPAYVAFGLLLLQAIVSPFVSPIALLWLSIDRRVPADRFGNLYFDLAGARGAAAISCLVLTAALGLIHWVHLPTLGRVLIGAPAASCILSATVGFCAGCGYYVLGRDMLVRSGLVRGAPEGVRDVDVERG
ncbi:MAG: hypothetical protein IT375_18630 [Polyangiaceae bacterium]|nr:hypothetical protein [Polyangiaceae bacterium]